MVGDLLGKPTFNYDVADRVEIPGVATGLAVTAVGGDILFVEITKMPGEKGLRITGQLGEVMEESVQAAVSYVRSQATRLGIDPDFFKKTDIHVHIPAGATPKDGPSAGVTLVTALTSLLTGKSVRKDVGMTGEITLVGKVLPVGGIKDKVLAAHRAGLKTVIMPSRNEQDLEDLPESTRNEMNFVLVDHVDAVLAEALFLPPVPDEEPEVSHASS
jgi:ATP-dependent Lon protease